MPITPAYHVIQSEYTKLNLSAEIGLKPNNVLCREHKRCQYRILVRALFERNHLSDNAPFHTGRA